jgi:hypothetical protein
VNRQLADAHASLGRSRQALASLLEGIRGRRDGSAVLLGASAESMRALQHARSAIEAIRGDSGWSSSAVPAEFRRECEAIADLIALAHAEARRSLGETEDEMRRMRGLRARLDRQRERFESARDCDVSA